MAYMSHKKKQSKQKDKQKDKGNVKKTLISFSDKRPMDFGDGKNKQNSDKKVNRSILSL